MPDSIPPHIPPAGTAQRPLQRWRGGTRQQQVDVVAEEVPVAEYVALAQAVGPAGADPQRTPSP